MSGKLLYELSLWISPVNAEKSTYISGILKLLNEQSMTEKTHPKITYQDSQPASLTF